MNEWKISIPSGCSQLILSLSTTYKKNPKSLNVSFFLFSRNENKLIVYFQAYESNARSEQQQQSNQIIKKEKTKVKIAHNSTHPSITTANILV